MYPGFRKPEFKQYKLNDHDKEMIEILKTHNWTYLGNINFTENDCETEVGYGIVRSMLIDWYREEEASNGDL